MKSKIFFLLMAGFTFCEASIFGQSTILGNNGTLGTQYLGWNNATTFDLNIKHEGNYPIIFSTNGLERARITNDGRLFVGTTSATLGKVVVEDNSSNGVGVRSRASGANVINVGGWFTGNGGIVGNGAYGIAVNTAATRNYGVYGEACNAPTNYAVYGIACQNANNWAGYFVGKTFCTSGVWDASDATLKTNVSNLDNATAILMALNPKSYHFVSEYPSLNLPQGLQYGLIAQELEEVIPHAVTEVSSPPQFDSEGNILSEGINFKGVNYTQLIPVLIAGFKEQAETSDQNKSMHDELMTRLAKVQADLNNLRSQDTELKHEMNRPLKKVILESSFPNPFESETLIPFNITESGIVRVDIVDVKGSLILTLKNEMLNAGSHSVTWNASAMSKGIYYCVIRHGSEVQAQRLMKQ